MSKTRILIMGAAGRDFHNFNTFYRDNDQYHVAAFTATQIPDIEGRVYPAELTGDLCGSKCRNMVLVIVPVKSVEIMKIAPCSPHD
jgi:predicted GTPase